MAPPTPRRQTSSLRKREAIRSCSSKPPGVWRFDAGARWNETEDEKHFENLNAAWRFVALCPSCCRVHDRYHSGQAALAAGREKRKGACAPPHCPSAREASRQTGARHGAAPLLAALCPGLGPCPRGVPVRGGGQWSARSRGCLRSSTARAALTMRTSVGGLGKSRGSSGYLRRGCLPPTLPEARATLSVTSTSAVRGQCHWSLVLVPSRSDKEERWGAWGPSLNPVRAGVWVQAQRTGRGTWQPARPVGQRWLGRPGTHRPFPAVLTVSFLHLFCRGVRRMQ